MKTSKITFRDIFQTLDDSFVEEYYFRSDVSVPSEHEIQKKVKKKLHPHHRIFLRGVVCCAVTLVFALPLMTYGIPHILEQSEILNDGNRGFVGKSIVTDHYIIYDPTQDIYRDQDGNIVDIAKTPDPLSENRIISSITIPEDPDFSPASIVEIPVTEEGKKNTWSVPELILINASVCVLTGEDGDGWQLSSGSEIRLSFEKYPSEVVHAQTLLIAYVQDGVMHSWESFREQNGVYTFTVPEDGMYHFYFMSASSDYLSLRNSTLELVRDN